MALVKSLDERTTTLIVDAGHALVSVYVSRPIDEVQKILAAGEWVSGDSPLGEIHVSSASVKYMQTGKREINGAASNRPSNLPL